MPAQPVPLSHVDLCVVVCVVVYMLPRENCPGYQESYEKQPMSWVLGNGKTVEMKRTAMLEEIILKDEVESLLKVYSRKSLVGFSTTISNGQAPTDLRRPHASATFLPQTKSFHDTEIYWQLFQYF